MNGEYYIYRLSNFYLLSPFHVAFEHKILNWIMLHKHTTLLM